jgi:hypothetical protein
MAKPLLTMWLIAVKMHGGNSVCLVALCKAERAKTVHCPLFAFVHFNQSSSHKNEFLQSLFQYWIRSIAEKGSDSSVHIVTRIRHLEPRNWVTIFGRKKINLFNNALKNLGSTLPPRQSALGELPLEKSGGGIHPNIGLLLVQGQKFHRSLPSFLFMSCCLNTQSCRFTSAVLSAVPVRHMFQFLPKLWVIPSTYSKYQELFSLYPTGFCPPHLLVTLSINCTMRTSA